MKFETFADQWFEEYAKLNLRPTTYERMLQLKKRIYPAIGHMRMDKITRRDIRLFINDLAQNGRNFNNDKPLSKKTIVHHLSFISDVFNYAVDLDLIYDNPCRNIKIPNMGEEKEKEIYSPEELDRLFLLLKNEPLKYRVFFTLAVYTGFRKGELLGLEWKDIDWDNRIIYVRRTSNYTGKKGIYTGRPKTKRSKRCNRYPQELFDLLKEFKDEQDLDRQRIGDEWQDYDRLFVKADGQPMNTRTPYGWLKEFCERNDLRFCTIHSLRHSHASILIAAGVDVATVSADLGHSNCNTTLGVYTHEFQRANVLTAEVIGNSIHFCIDSECETGERKVKDHQKNNGLIMG